LPVHDRGQNTKKRRRTSTWANCNSGCRKIWATSLPSGRGSRHSHWPTMRQQLWAYVCECVENSQISNDDIWPVRHQRGKAIKLTRSSLPASNCTNPGIQLTCALISDERGAGSSDSHKIYAEATTLISRQNSWVYECIILMVIISLWLSNNRQSAKRASDCTWKKVCPLFIYFSKHNLKFEELKYFFIYFFDRHEVN